MMAEIYNRAGEPIDNDEDDGLDDDEDNDTYCSPLPCEEREGWDDERDAPCIGDLCCCPHVDHSRDECFTAEEAEDALRMDGEDMMPIEGDR